MRLIYAALLAVFCALSADAGQLSGTVRGLSAASPDQASINPYPASLGALGEVEAPHSAVVGFVYIDSLRRPGPSAPEPALRQRGQNFVPALLAVPTGRHVAFPNDDPILHNVFSYSKAKRFDLGRYGQGKSKSVLFDKPGVVRIFCDVHSNMAATIVVVDSDYIAALELDGKFRFENVPDGEHELVVWQSDGPQFRRTVAVEGAVTDLTIGP